jgi:two-component system, NarL family, sensor histidine kinase UhpB
VINKCSTLVQRLLHIPLFYKVFLANAVIVTLMAVTGIIIAGRLPASFPTNSHYGLIAVLVVTGLAISFAVNLLVLKLALAPLDRLQTALDDARGGKTDVQISAGIVSDKQFDQLVATLNGMLTALEENGQQLHHLSQEILQAQEEERQRVARELHDEAAQTLTSLLVYLKLLEKSQDPEEAQRVQNLRKLTAHALEEIRQVALELRPTILDDWGLEAALGWRVDELSKANAIRVTLQVAGMRDRLPRDLEVTFYRVAQEAMNNIARHSHARHAQIMLKREERWLMLEIKDDGVGFNTTVMQAGRLRGLGLLGMRERLALVGGELTIESQPGKGTRLIARAPLASPIASGELDGKDSRTISR